MNKDSLYYVDCIVDEYVELRKGGVSNPLVLIGTLLRAVSVLKKINKEVRTQDPHFLIKKY